MAKRKKPEDETVEQAAERQLFEQISNAANRSEKTSWNRKLDNMVKLLVELEPIEAEILDLITKKKNPIMDQVSQLRKVMVLECVHPYEYLSTDINNVVHCKFCGRKITLTTNNGRT